jgi:hypothetical protein
VVSKLIMYVCMTVVTTIDSGRTIMEFSGLGDNQNVVNVSSWTL